ncbi:MAG: DUF4114 domain-containing protein [Oscillatoriales cyanobacterium SM2_2_1]|nr:DUF4114 domain-containing protein [Oscillatoriales cyanobacterium SM2_2_1]
MVRISEIFFNPPGTDGPNEFVELVGTPGSVIPANTFLVGIEGDAGGNPGDVQTIFNLSGLTFGSNGYLVLLQQGSPYTPAAGATAIISTTAGFGGLPGAIFSTDGGTDIENASVTFLLYQSATAPTLTTDFDADNNGSPELLPTDAVVLDSVAILDSTGAGDIAYAGITFRQNAAATVLPGTVVVETPAFTAGYVGRVGASTGSTANDWVASETVGASPNFTLSVGTTAPATFDGTAINTVGSINPTPAADPRPTATLVSAPNISVAGGTTQTIVVRFQDNNAINVGTLDSLDLRVTGPNGFNTLATFVSVDTNTNGTPRQATYQITAPGGTFDFADVGSYSIALEANQVSDDAGQFAAASTLGSFSVSIPSPGFLTKIGDVKSANGAEIPAVDPVSKRLFVVAGTVVEIFDLSNPAVPTLTGQLPLNTTNVATGFAALPNSVAVGKKGTVSEGLVAVAVAIVGADNLQARGEVQFFDAATGAFLRSVQAGFLPDYVVFTPDGLRVLTADEGEPNEAYTVDPEGSVTIIDLRTSGGVAGIATGNVPVATADFTAFNNRKEELRQQGVRIFGPNATVAQDLEPEYIAFSGDGSRAWVTLQENNALAVVNVETATVERIVPLGFKDYSKDLPTLKTFDWNNRPVLGTTATVNPTNASQTTPGQEILLGGFSGLAYRGTAGNGNLIFVTHPDRGPNGEPTDILTNLAGNERPFALPNYQSRIVSFELNQATGAFENVQETLLFRQDGTTPITGRPNLQAGSQGSAFTDEVGVDLFGNRLDNDALGADLEGIAFANDSTFWMVDEYRPAIYHFNANGVLIDRFVPQGTAASVNSTAGAFGVELFPSVYGSRRANRGFEAIAIDTDRNLLYAFIQSPLDNPDTTGDTTSRNSKLLRILELDISNPATPTVSGEFVYVLNDISGAGTARTDKIGDAAYIGNGRFYVAERDDRTDLQGNKLIYEIDIKNATNINNLAVPLPTGKTGLEQLTVDELVAAGVRPVFKQLVVNASSLGYQDVSKLEGLAVIDANRIAILNDQDFGLQPAPITGNGTISLDSTPEPVRLGIIEFNKSNGLDPSDQDGGINIRKAPVLGIYQPDAVASFVSGGQSFFVIANEGDSRDRDGFSEEARLSARTLDPIQFPNAAELQANTNLGRLITTSTGDLDGDGDQDRIVSFGARSFSIVDSAGNIIFDSGDDFERITAAALPNFFNASNANNTLDNRSDDKGPEPEGVAVGTINDRSYAFIGAERIGGVFVYEVTDPRKPTFVQYLNTRDFTVAPATSNAGPEGVLFVPASDSPNGQPLLVVSNEVSNTTEVFSINTGTRISDIQGAAHRSPLEGQTVTTRGVVTVIRSNGFFIQDPTPDNNPSTAEGIFVFTSSAPNPAVVQVGASVSVRGRVDEFRPGNNANNLSITQVNASVSGGLVESIASLGTITPVVLGEGGRAIPTQAIKTTPITQTLSLNALAFADEIQQPNITPNTGATGRFTYNLNGNTLTVTGGSYSQLTSALIANNPITLNVGAPRAFGTEIGALTVTQTSTVAGTFTGTFTLTAEQTTAAQEGRLYINISTTNLPVGELRGQLGPNVELSPNFDPVVNALDFFESLEGTVVQINRPVAVSPTAEFGGGAEEIWVLADAGAGVANRNPRGGVTITPDNFNPSRIQIDDEVNSTAFPKVTVGDELSTVVGVVSYDFNNYEVLVTAANTPTIARPSNLQPEVTNLAPATGQLTVANYNVENLDPSDGARFNTIAQQVVTNLKSPDIINLVEIQDNNGATNDGTVGAGGTYSILIDAIVAAGGPRYEFRDINPVNNQDGGEPGGNIRVGFLFNPQRVQFVERGTTPLAERSIANTAVTNVNGKPQLSLSPGRILDQNLADGNAFNASRKPLVGEFLFNGQTVFVVGNHWNSKGGDQPLFGPTQPPEVYSETQRLQIAREVNAFVDSILAIDAAANVIVLGDLNDFGFSRPLDVVRGTEDNRIVLFNLNETVSPLERYTFNFQGNSQSLDHILVSQNLRTNLNGFDTVHVNTEFSDAPADHDPEVARFTLNAPTPPPAPTPVTPGVTNNIFTVGGLGRQTLQLNLTQVTTTKVNEIGFVIVQDNAGALLNQSGATVLPGSATYLAELLRQSRVLTSSLAQGDAPTGFNPNQVGRTLEVEAGQRVLFFLVENGTVDGALNQVRNNQTPTNIKLGNDTSNLRFSSQVTNNTFTLSFEDGNDADFNDAVVTVAPKTIAPPRAAALQGSEQGEALDLRGLGDQLATFTVNREAAFNNFVGFYRVDNPTGQIGTVSPTAANQTDYVAAALANRVSGLGLNAPNQGTATEQVVLSGGSILAPFIITNVGNSTFNEAIARLTDSNTGNDPNIFFPYLGVNPGSADHVRLLGDNTFGFEDINPTLGASDLDYNDIIVRVSFA